MDGLKEKQPKLKKAATKALNTVLKNRDAQELYKKALANYGEGELLTKILDYTIATMEKENSYEGFFASEDTLVSVCCAVWLQFLMVEIGGINQDRLQVIAKNIFEEQKKSITIH